jgi:hypothetical protein
MTDSLPATTQSTDEKRGLALLKAVGFDRLAPEQRELALAICNRYDLDPLLKHLVMIEGRAYITRDGLLHVAHRSGALDGIVSSEPELTGEYWRATVSVYRRDMSHPFTYTGRYPAKGGNQRFAPEMAVKVGEVMALRRAFDVAAPTAEERWDLPAPELFTEPERPTLRERAQARVAELEPQQPDPVTEAMAANDQEYCDSPSPYEDAAHCVLPPGHKGNHRSEGKESWT